MCVTELPWPACIPLLTRNPNQEMGEVALKKKLLIVVGAGASVEFGMPSVSEVDKIFALEAQRYYPLAHDTTKNLYQFFQNEVQRYYDQHAKPALRKWTNFEELIYIVNLVASNIQDHEFQRGANALFPLPRIPDVAEHAVSRKSVTGDMLRRMSAGLLDKLVEEFITRCSTLGTGKAAEIADMQTLLNALADDFDLGIFTLNYDNVFSLAKPGLHTGFNQSNGKFEPDSVLNRSDWNYLYHLHGSVHFQLVPAPGEFHGIAWTDTPTFGNDVKALNRNPQSVVEGTDFPISIFIAGYGKTMQALRQPYRTYLAQLNRAAHEAEAILFVGYGFADLHVNSVFSHIRERCRPTVIIDFAQPTQDPLQFRNDTWAWNLEKTVLTGRHTMAAPSSSSAPYIGDLRDNKEFEVSPNSNTPLAVWYDGMISACQNSQKIIRHLN